jgi:hypothetical protein
VLGCDAKLGVLSALPRYPMTYMVVQCGRLMFENGTLNIWSYAYLLRLWLPSFPLLDRGVRFPPLSNSIPSEATDLHCVD